MVVMHAEDLEETHPRLPEGWSRSFEAIQRDGGPWTCNRCELPSYLIYRCSKCGRDLAEEGARRSQQ